MKMLMLLLFLTPYAFGNCSKVDLNSSAPLKDMAVVDQDGTGLCYAYSTAQLLEFYLKKNGSKFVPSAIDISLTAMTNGVPSFLEPKTLEDGNTPNYVVRLTKYVGLAERSCINKQIKQFSKSNQISSEKFINLLHQVYTSANQKTNDKTEYQNMLKRAQTDKFLKYCEPAMKTIFEQGDWGKPVTEILKKIILPCERFKMKSPLAKMDFQYKMAGSDAKLKSTVDSLLNARKPSVLDICQQILSGPAPYKGLNRNGLLSDTLPRFTSLINNSKCNPHSVLAVARRPANGSCQYLIRNSWGGAWKPQSFTCACKTKSAYYEDCKTLVTKTVKEKTPAAVSEYRSRVYVGCWVDEKNLFSNSIGAGGIR